MIPNSDTQQASKPPHAEAPPMPEAFLRSLHRVHQLASEIRQSLQQGDLMVVSQASRLLAPALQQCHAQSDQATPQALEQMQETAELLTECETALLLAMQNVTRELRSLRQGRRTLAARRPMSPSIGRRLDSRQ